ncbi:hypothetical protein FXO37_24740 [Capsicum annuum]|nr:hypothetical protein FXO37_24740 [Capsicum annuum]
MGNETFLTWIICGNKLFVGSYLSPAEFLHSAVLLVLLPIIEKLKLIYCPDIYSTARNEPVVSVPEESEVCFSTSDVKGTLTKLRQQNKLWSSVTRSNSLNCLITCSVPETHHNHASVALACSSNSELWQYVYCPSDI